MLDLPESRRIAILREAERRYMIIRPIVEARTRGERFGRAQIEAAAMAHGTAAATIYRWLACYAKAGIVGLMDRPRADRGAARVVISKRWERFVRAAGMTTQKTAEIAAEMVAVVRGLWAANSTTGAPQVAMLAEVRLVELTAAALGADPRAVKTACRLARRFVEGERRFGAVAVQAQDGKRFYDEYTPSVRRTREGLKPGDLVLGDVTPLDVPVFRPDGTVGYARVIAWMDAATNYLHATLYLPAGGSGVRREHVAAAFAHCAEDAPFGMARRLYLDNGSEFQWMQMFDGWAELVRLTAGAFGGAWAGSADAYGQVARIVRSTPFRPRGKSIEGIFGNLLAYLSWVPGFIGSDRLRKKVATLGKGVQPRDFAEVRAALAEAIALYNATPQQGWLAGKSPAEAIEDHLNSGWSKLMPNAQAMALAFADRFEPKVHAGKVTIGGVVFYADALNEWHGHRVKVRHWRLQPDVAYVLLPNNRVVIVQEDLRYAYLDPEGAKEAARRAAEARRAVTLMRGQVAVLEPLDLMRRRRELSGADEVPALADQRATRIAVSAEAQALLDAMRAQAEAALAAAGTQKNELVHNRMGIVDEEAEAVRAALGL